MSVDHDAQQKELRFLVKQIEAHPERDHGPARERVALLRQVIGARQPAA